MNDVNKGQQFTPEQLAVSALQAWINVAELVGSPKSIGIHEGIKDVKRAYGVDFAPLLGEEPIDDDDEELRVTSIYQLAEQFQMSTDEANDFLFKAGLQYFDGKDWVPTLVGDDKYCIKRNGAMLWDMEKVIKDFCQF